MKDSAPADAKASEADAHAAAKPPYVNPPLAGICQGRARPAVDGPAPSFRKVTLSEQPGTGYVKPHDADGDGYPELLLTTLTEGLDLSQVASGPPLAFGGAYVLSRKTVEPAGALPQFSTRTVFDRGASIAWPNASEVFDLDRDGVLDWVVGAGFLTKPVGSIVWMKGAADGTFAAPRALAVPDAACWYHETLPLDMDQDGDTDFITTCHVGKVGDATAESRLEWFESPGDGSDAFVHHAIGQGGGALLTLFDVDADGDEDIFAPQFFEGEPLVWYEHKADASFAKHVISDDTGRGFIVRLADVDGDGRTDVVYGNHNNELASTPAERTMGIYWFAVPPPDKLASLTHWNDYRHTVYEGFEVYGDGNATSAGAPGMLNVGDLDGDCDIDITASGDGDPGLYAFIQGTEGFSPKVLDQSPNNVNSGEQHVLDLDLDGDFDIVWAVFGPNDPALLLSTGLSSRVYAFVNE